MKKHLYLLSAFVLFVAQFAASTPSQIGHFQAEVPEKLKKLKLFNILYLCYYFFKYYIIVLILLNKYYYINK